MNYKLNDESDKFNFSKFESFNDAVNEFIKEEEKDNQNSSKESVLKCGFNHEKIIAQNVQKKEIK